MTGVLSRLRLLAVAVLAAVGLAGAALAVALHRPAPAARTTVVRTVVTEAAEAFSPRAIAARAAPGVVSILATTTVESEPTPFAPPSSEEAVVSGSGFVLDREGHIVTSEHVVAEARTIHVSFADGRTVHAKLVAQDPLFDLAVLSVDVPASALHPLTLGSADTLRLGDPIVAVGNPFGLTRSVSTGIVSGLNRSMVAPNGFTIANAVQTDAAINHGNSGGPLLDRDGRVVAIAAQIADSGIDANVGVAFGVAIDRPTVRAIGILAKGGTVEHAWLGVSLSDIDAILGTSGRVPVRSGALVTGIVAGGPAAKAGLTGGSTIASVDGARYCVGGDTIVAVGPTRVRSATGLEIALSGYAPSDTATFRVVHADGTTANVKVTLGSQPTAAPEATQGCS